MFFSVIIPTFNRPALLERALKSLKSQTFHDFEVLIVNDGSTLMLEQYNSLQKQYDSDNRFKFLSKKNGGASSARNYGIKVAQGKFVSFLDDDDEFLPNHLQELSLKIEANAQRPAMYRTLTFVNNGKGESKQSYKELNQATPMIRLFGNFVVPCSVVVASEMLRKHTFNERVPISEDYELWTRFALEYDYVEIPKYTTIYHLHEASTSSSDEEKVQVKHIRAFRQIFSIRGVKRALPLRMRAELFAKRYLWYSEVKRRKKRLLQALRLRMVSEFYGVLSRI